MSRDTSTCPVCQASIYSEDYADHGCHHCKAPVTLCKIMDDILEEHYEELEAAGVSLFGIRIDEPPVIVYLRTLWLEKEKLRAKHEALALVVNEVAGLAESGKRFTS